MIAKITRGSGFKGVLEYNLAAEKHAVIVGGTTGGTTVNALAAQLIAAAATRPEIEKPVWHCSLSLPPGERPTDEKWRKITADFMRAMKFGPDVPWVAIRHHDTEHDNVHIVASRVGYDAKVWLGQHEVPRAHRAARELEEKHSLKPALAKNRKTYLPPHEQRAAEDNGDVPPARQRIQDAIDAALARPMGLDDFTAALAAEGITVRRNQASTGRISGISFAAAEAGGAEVAFKGSKLGKQYSWAALQKRGLGQQQEKHNNEEQKDHQDNKRAAAAAEIRDDAGAAGRDTGQDGGRDVGASAQDEQRSGISITPGEKGLLTPRPIEEQRAMEAWEAAQAAKAQRNQDKPSRPPETADERKRRLCSRAPREPEKTQPEPAQAAQAPAQEIEADAEEIARIIAEAEAWDRRMAQEPPPADINEHCDRARESAALHYRADRARQGVILPLESGEVQRAAQRAEEQAWETYVPHRSEPEPQAQDNNQDDNNPRLAAWKRDLEAAGAPPPRKDRDRDDFSR